jgi:subtilase family serine protease
MRTSVAVLAVLAAGIVVASSVSLAHSGRGAPTPAPAGGALVTDAVSLPSGASTVAVPARTPIVLSLTLAYPHPSELAQFLASVEDPASPQYRHYLTHAQFESDFAPSPSAVAQVVASLASDGAHAVTVSPDRLIVSAQLSAARVDSLFGVRMAYVTGVDGGRLYTALGVPELPASWQGLVSGVAGLSNAADFRLTFNLDPVNFGSPAPGPSQFVVNNSSGARYFMGSDFTQLFGATSLLPGNSSIINATYPTHVAIATLLASGYNNTQGSTVNTPPFDPRAIDAYFNDTLNPKWPVSNVTGVNLTIGGVPSPAPGFSSDYDDSLDSIENSLDLEMAGSLAPGAPLYNFYFAGSLLLNALTDADVAGYFVQDLAAALSYNYSSASAHLGVVSCSFGIPDLNESGWNAELQEAAALGVTVVAASGDQGNAPDSLTGRGDGPWPLWPATAAFNTSGAVSVGGVTVEAGGSSAGWFNDTNYTLNATYDPTVGSITKLSTWWTTSGGAGYYAGSEGGISTVDPEPDWQFHSAAQPNIVNVSVQQGVSTLGRAGPDIAFPANNTIAYVYANASGGIYYTILGGTSIAAPAFAGFLADEIAVAHHDFGFVDPEIYRIESYFTAFPGPANPFYDVTNGSNYFFAATHGWDATTGWGAPLAELFYSADADSGIANYTYHGPTPLLPTATPPPGVPWTEIVVIFGVGVTVAVVLILVMARPPRNPLPPPAPANAPMPPPAPGAFPTAASPPGGATFICPYCGAVRPAEPVRCPRCGAL